MSYQQENERLHKLLQENLHLVTDLLDEPDVEWGESGCSCGVVYPSLHIYGKLCGAVDAEIQLRGYDTWSCKCANTLDPAVHFRLYLNGKYDRWKDLFINDSTPTLSFTH